MASKYCFDWFLPPSVRKQIFSVPAFSVLNQKYKKS